MEIRGSKDSIYQVWDGNDWIGADTDLEVLKGLYPEATINIQE